MRAFFVTARTAGGHPEYFTRFATCSAEAGEQVASLFNEPCGITVVPGVR
jgi:hypothetical protein